LAGNKDDKDKKEADRLNESAIVLKEILGMPEGIPEDLLDKTVCVVVYPSVKKAAFIVGGSCGRGVITRRSGKGFNGGWSAPAMVALESGSFGFQIGAQATDFVLLIMNESATNKAIYGKDLSAKEIVREGKAHPPVAVRRLLAILTKASPKRVESKKD
jgi:lipid-binding SYLF domain-containing protein